MPTFKFKGKLISTNGPLPELETMAPDFVLTRNDLSDVNLSSFGSRYKILSVFPSIDTPTCATSVRTFNKKAAKHPDVVILNISADLPFAQKRFCGTENIENTETLSTFRGTFAKDYGVQIMEGPLKNLCARALFVLDRNNNVILAEIVSELTQEPNYSKVFEVMMNGTKS